MNSPSFQPAVVTPFDQHVLACPPGSFPWDDWQREAAAAGVAPDLASLGRAVMREAYQHGWCDELKRECGIDNPETARGMIAVAKDQPFLAASRWHWLLATDGLRFDPWDHQEFAEDSPAWREMRRRWESEVSDSKELQLEADLFRDALRYIEDFYDLDQLALVDLTAHAISRGAGGAILWADFTVIESARPDRIAHSGIVRVGIEHDSSGIEAAIFEQVEKES